MINLCKEYYYYFKKLSNIILHINVTNKSILSNFSYYSLIKKKKKTVKLKNEHGVASLTS